MYLNSEGIILRQTRATGGRKMILLFTKKYGKLSVGASQKEKGKNRSSLAMHPFTYGNYQIFEGRNYYNMDRAETIRSFYRLGEDLDKYMYAAYVLELTEKVIPEGVPQPAVFDLLIETLGELEERQKQHETLVLAFEIKLLQILGLFPHIKDCVLCGKPADPHSFSVSAGGIICDECAKNTEDSLIYHTEFDIVEVLNYYAFHSLKTFRKIALNDHVARELAMVIRDYFSYHLDVGDMKSESIFTNRIE